MKSQIFNHGGPTFQKVKKVAKPYFEPVGISEVSGEPELRTNQVDTNPVEIEYL